MTTTEEKFLAFLCEQNMLRPGVLVTVGVSGGADSVCLLFLLQKYRETLGIRLQAVHLNHRIRACAGEDAAFCIRAKEYGYEIWIDPTVKLGHVGQTVITEGVYKSRRKVDT